MTEMFETFETFSRIWIVENIVLFRDHTEPSDWNFLVRTQWLGRSLSQKSKLNTAISPEAARL